MHHKPETPLQRIIATTDRLALEKGADRAEKARLEALSPNLRAIEAFRKKLGEAPPIVQPTSGPLWGEANKLLRSGESGGWSGEERRALARLCREELSTRVEMNKKKRAEFEDRLAGIEAP
ncbi:MAG: hypothetical protein HQL57_04445 [Magnetococcales bacterium]|nr:hypothetical protein [Magnetococcales bacterium]